jgi:dTDP-4-amino-4,6-dideoxygalactose transaminase
LRAAGIGPGHAVFVPSFTFVASAEAIVTVGATPVFVDVDDHTYNLSVDHLQQQLDHLRGEKIVSSGTPKNLRPSAVLAVDLFGYPADYDRLIPFCDHQELTLIGDGAQSFGATLNRRSTFGMLDYACTSFFPAKPLGGYGDGGAVFCSSDESASVIRSLLVHGKGKDKYDNVRHGYNSRLDTLQAAILLEKLQIFDEELEAKRRIAQFYSTELAGSSPRLSVPEIQPRASSPWAQYTIRVENRDHFVKSLKASGIPCAVYYPKGIHQQTAYANLDYQAGSLPVTERLCQEVVSLPMHAYLTNQDQQTIVSAVRKALSETT